MITFDGSLIEILMMLDGKSSWHFDRKIRALIADPLAVCEAGEPGDKPCGQFAVAPETLCIH